MYLEYDVDNGYEANGAFHIYVDGFDPPIANANSGATKYFDVINQTQLHLLPYPAFLSAGYSVVLR